MTLPSLPLSLENEEITLKPTGHWPETQHVFSRKDLLAINLALAAGRPLLLRGEPGCGKSQLARAAAHELSWPLLAKVVNARCEPEDLLYRFDAVARLAQAQILPRDSETMEQLAAEKFLLPEILWWAMDHIDAARRHDVAKRHCGSMGCDYALKLRDSFATNKGCVVLIDEIDKADSEVPNSLLEAFSLGGFALPYGGGAVTPKNSLPPLIIVTTNEDRDLPAAFVRRCLVHQMDPPKADQEAALKSYFIRRVTAHYPDELELSLGVRDLAIERLVKDRKVMESHDLPKPGLAELLDLLRGLVNKGHGTELERVNDFAEYVFNKHRLD